MTWVGTVGDLLDALAHTDPDTRIAFEYDTPAECCEGHVHDITLFVDAAAEIHAVRHAATIRLSGGYT